MNKEIHLRNGEGYDKYIYLLEQTTAWIAEQYHTSPDFIRFTCGATGALDAILSLFDKGSVIGTMPFEYFDVRRLAEARNLIISTQEQPNNVYLNSIETFIGWLKETKPDGCYISWPNNPNGQEYSKEYLKDIFTVMKGKIVIVDQSLLADQVIPFEWFLANRAQSRLFVVRSFSKSHGLVGERIGMLFSYEELHKIHTYAHAPSASSLQNVRKKWKSNYAIGRLRMINKNCVRMTTWGNGHQNLFVAPSRTNCACIHFYHASAQDISRHLKDSGIFVNSNTDLGIGGNFIRVDITVPTKSIKMLMSCIDVYFGARET